MTDVLKDQWLGSLIAEIAEITGEAPPPLVRRALEERLERLGGRRSAADELAEIAMRHAALVAAADAQPDSIPLYLGAAN